MEFSVRLTLHVVGASYHLEINIKYRGWFVDVLGC